MNQKQIRVFIVATLLVAVEQKFPGSRDTFYGERRNLMPIPSVIANGRAA